MGDIICARSFTSKATNEDSTNNRAMATIELSSSRRPVASRDPPDDLVRLAVVFEACCTLLDSETLSSGHKLTVVTSTTRLGIGVA